MTPFISPLTLNRLCSIFEIHLGCCEGPDFKNENGVVYAHLNSMHGNNHGWHDSIF